MKILSLTQVLPYPPDSGPKIKTYNVLKCLAERHEMTLASFVRGDQSADVHELAKLCQAVYTVPIDRSKWREPLYGLRSLATRVPAMMARDHRPAMHKLIARLCAQEQFDVVHVDQHNMFQYAERIHGPRRVFDAHNALWLLYRRQWATTSPGPYKWFLNRDWRLFRRYEAHILRESDAVLAVTQVDKNALLDLLDQPKEITVVPIVIDTKEIEPIDRVHDASHILHFGTMSWPPNVDGVRWFIRDVLPIVRERHPDAVFDIVGSRPPKDLVSLGQSLPGIDVTGYVQDPLPYQRQAALMVVPLLAGGGMRVKILNALAEGIPIVSTSLGCEGIDVVHGEHAMIADAASAFADRVLELLDDADLGARLAANGRRLVEQKYDYRQVCPKLNQVYSRMGLS